MLGDQGFYYLWIQRFLQCILFFLDEGVCRIGRITRVCFKGHKLNISVKHQASAAFDVLNQVFQFCMGDIMFKYLACFS